ncbi:Protein kinase-like domain protein [Niveomyces insectorum RCEF 264]|uniref:IkappaB kinase n=1 Tax=Niveomyces insectorum RCEF 264 TaxID=1081102 RepID=A0A167RHJ5_9HYPO|nr:Protein kinase-like domain protein [Niveomyces insectorum RCEF 264]
MADQDLIARLYPSQDGAGIATEAVTAKWNVTRMVPATVSAPETTYDHHEREATQDPVDSGGSHLDCYPCLELRFSQPPATSHGYVFGWDAKCDVRLARMSGISFHHLALTFDDQYRLVIKDLGSLAGTEVLYNEQGRGKRSDFVWIVGGHDMPQKRGKIIVVFHRHLQFEIVVSSHDITSQSYMDKVDQLRQGTANAEDLLGGLDLSRPQTERASGAQTPGTGPIFLTEKLGEGTFGVVTRLFNVSTGEECALKEPSARAVRKRTVKVDAWKKEARIMGRISHDHIVAFFGSDFTSSPRLWFEYVPRGTLSEHDLSVVECVQVARQCLSALAYLHGQDPPIVHRDIKPDNILVQDRYGDAICVKFGDFGLSRASRDPTTICGSLQYLAPEIYREQKRRHTHREKSHYTSAVDVWSLGVTIFECAYRLPSSNATGIAWCEEVVRKLEGDALAYPDDLKQFLWYYMVVMVPELRQSAQFCHDQALLLTGLAQVGFQTPTATSYVQDHPHIESHDRGLEDTEDAGQDSAAHDGESSAATASPSVVDEANSADERRRIRSNGPPPDAGVPQLTRKKANGSSSSGRRDTKRHRGQQLAPQVTGPSFYVDGGSPSGASNEGEQFDPDPWPTEAVSLPAAGGPMDDGSIYAEPLQSELARGSTDNLGEQELVAKLQTELNGSREGRPS